MKPFPMLRELSAATQRVPAFRTDRLKGPDRARGKGGAVGRLRRKRLSEAIEKTLDGAQEGDHSRWNQEDRQLMSKTKHSHHEYEGPDSDGVNHGFHRPYWKHAHHDWRLWIAVSLMLVALLT